MNVLALKQTVRGARQVCERPDPHLSPGCGNAVPFSVVRKFDERLDEYIIAPVVPDGFDVAKIRKRRKCTRVLGGYLLLAAQIDPKGVEGPTTFLGKHCNGRGDVVLVFRQGVQLRQS